MDNVERLLSGGSLGNCCLSGDGLFSCRSGSSLLAAASSGLGGLLLSVLGIGLIIINELDHAHLGIVTLTEAGFEDTGVTTGTVSDFLRNLTIEFGDGILVMKI